jgi:hypothetical protein
MDQDSLRIREELPAFVAVFGAQAGLLVAAERVFLRICIVLN